MQGWAVWRACPAPTSWENRKNKVTLAAQGSTQMAFLGTKPCKVCWKSPLHPVHQLGSLRDCPSQGLQGPHCLTAFGAVPSPVAPHGLQGHPKSRALQPPDICGITLTPMPFVSHTWDCSEPSAPHSPWDGPKIRP